MYVKINPDYETGPVISIPTGTELENKTVEINLQIGSQNASGSFHYEIKDDTADYVVIQNISNVSLQINSVDPGIVAEVISKDFTNFPQGQVNIAGLVPGITVDDQLRFTIDTSTKIPKTTIGISVKVKI